jgi:hypothetical protein
VAFVSSKDFLFALPRRHLKLVSMESWTSSWSHVTFSTIPNVVALNQFYGAESSPLPELAKPNQADISRQLQFSIDFEF